MPEQGTQDLRRPDPRTAFRFLIRVGDSQQISAAFSRRYSSTVVAAMLTLMRRIESPRLFL